MTQDELEFYWNRGWKDYCNGVNQNNCPTYREQEKRDEWMNGWLTAQYADSYAGWFTTEESDPDWM